MKRLVIALAALLPLAGCATPYGYSPGAWAYYDDDYDWGQDGYDRPITYYGESAAGLPYGNPGYAQAPPHYSEQTSPDYAGEPPEPSSQCNCYSRPRRRLHQSQAQPPAHDPSWYSTYYSIGP